MDGDLADNAQANNPAGFLATPHGGLDGTSDLAIDLSGKIELPEDLTLEISGTAKVMRCPPR